MGRKGSKKEVSFPEHCTSIREYEVSPWWRRTSSELLENKSCVCAVCGRPRWKWLTRKEQWKRVLRFSCHHVTYAHAGHELPGEIITVCSLCHTTCHDILRYKNISVLYAKLAKIVEEFFPYKGSDTFIPW
jgi:hypothetical protein